MIIILVIGIITALIIALATKREWLGPIISGLFFLLYGILSFAQSADALYFAILACFVQFMAAYKMYKMQQKGK